MPEQGAGSGPAGMRDEARAILERYARRTRVYDPADPAVYLPRQEMERRLAGWLGLPGLPARDRLTVLEVGCGSGENLAQLVRLGLDPEHLTGNELQPGLLATARRVLPPGVQLVPGDALDLEIAAGSVDVVYQAVVFSSILSDAYQEELARRMWGWVRPGGGVLWYDFVVDNPSNPDVRGVRPARIRQLFPAASIRSWRVTLAPPLGRLLGRLGPSFYALANLVPVLRTHRLCWLAKSAENS